MEYFKTHKNEKIGTIHKNGTEFEFSKGSTQQKRPTDTTI